ncbi:hypothetical protein GY45DRAFT_174245 [Cubamyces sp. BRFM 1775]|nr:hypothetical protein GY45DRAFT_174245 [Cubamyces sp. BRFM 1775]
MSLLLPSPPLRRRPLLPTPLSPLVPARPLFLPYPALPGTATHDGRGRGLYITQCVVGRNLTIAQYSPTIHHYLLHRVLRDFETLSRLRSSRPYRRAVAWGDARALISRRSVNDRYAVCTVSMEGSL